VALMDGAALKIYCAQLMNQESSAAIVTGLEKIVEQRSRFCSLYAEGRGHFFFIPVAAGSSDCSRKTQVASTPEQLGITFIPANNPQDTACDISSFGARLDPANRESKMQGMAALEADQNNLLRQEWIPFCDPPFVIAARRPGTAVAIRIGGARNRICRNQESGARETPRMNSLLYCNRRSWEQVKSLHNHKALWRNQNV